MFIRKLRRKIEIDPAHPSILLTVLGVGYRMARPAMEKEAG
jgi:DNA-binding response OmpR family regulator